MKIKTAILSLLTAASVVGATSASANTQTAYFSGGSVKVTYVQTVDGPVSPAQWHHCMKVMDSAIHCTGNAREYSGFWEVAVENPGTWTPTEAERAEIANLPAGFLLADQETFELAPTKIVNLHEIYNTDGLEYVRNTMTMYPADNSDYEDVLVIDWNTG